MYVVKTAIYMRTDRREEVHVYETTCGGVIELKATNSNMHVHEYICVHVHVGVREFVSFICVH